MLASRILCVRALVASSSSGAGASRGASRGVVSAVRDAAAKAMLNSALDSLSTSIGARAPPAAAGACPQLTANTEFDALTWKSIVDEPVTAAGADSLDVDDLYPPSAPSLAALLSAREDDGEQFLIRTAAAAASAGDRSANSSGINISGGSSLDLRAYPGAASMDPFALIAPDLRGINASIRALLGVDHPVLATVASYFFSTGWDGKKIRPALVLLMAHACNHTMAAGTEGGRYVASGAFTPSAAEVRAAQDVASRGVPTALPECELVPLPAQVALPLQRRLAEITELIHTASLLHDDVIDSADTRRGVGSVNAVFGNKLAVLAGDFLLARASICLARLRNVPAVELLSTVIEHLVKGEVMQMHTPPPPVSGVGDGGSSSADAAAIAMSRAAFDSYLRKSYYKTGSLMANSCKAIAMLGCYPATVWEPAFRYGFHLGIAFQLMDDLLDFDGTTASLGKPALADITQGLTTAPVLFAAHRFPSLRPLIKRKFERPGDVDAALKAVTAAGGIALTRRLAIAHGQLALEAIATLADSPARTALAAMVGRVITRTR